MSAHEQKKTLWNRLKDAASPYLLRHADDPVDWYPWGDEALEAAKRENKPILVSVGYSSCYWCHVMEREVFENPPIAELMNQYFINIKIDREERPDLDEYLMTARQLITREGGWPNNVFLTPDLKPFFAGGTYAPDDRYGKPGFPRLIESLHEAWETQREEVERSADEAMEAIAALLGHNRHEGEDVELSPLLAARLAQFCFDYEDKEAGGFYSSPKFPHERMLLCLQEIFAVTQSSSVGEMVQRALDGMAAGGIQDQLRGGFHRYAVDKEWKIPHFEKMLYTQALLARCYTRWHELRGHRRHRVIAERILQSVIEKFEHKEGGFYTAWDADTDGVEGAYYVWKREELENVLTPGELARFDSCYGLAEVPSFPGHPHPGGEVIFARKPLNELALQLGIPATGLWDELQRIHKKLLECRAARKRPPLDNKIIASWNGLMIDAFARGGMAFKENSYVEAAERAASFIWKHMRDENGHIYRIHSQGKAQHKAFLEDYTFLASGFLSLHRASGKKEWLEYAQELVKQTDDIFLDKTDHTYFYTDGSWQLPLRIKNAGDSAIPSGMSVMLHNLMDLYEITQDKSYLNTAEKLAAAYAPGMMHIPAEYAHMIHGTLRLLQKKNVPLQGLLSDIQQGTELSQANAESEHVRLSAVLERSHPFSQVVVTVSIAPGWHIAAQEGKAGPMLPASLMVRGEGVVEVVKIHWPEPTPFEAKYIERPAHIFEGEITIPVELRLAELTEETPHKLHVILRCQPCSQEQCVAPLLLSVDV